LVSSLHGRKPDATEFKRGSDMKQTARPEIRRAAYHIVDLILTKAEEIRRASPWVSEEKSIVMAVHAVAERLP
jgi:hypothetical protein